MAAASLLEAEVVTADGEVRIANACTNPDLFWALKGGGGGSFGVVTRLTLRTHALPETFGAVLRDHPGDVGRGLPPADRALRRLLRASALFNPHWGEQVGFRPGQRLGIAMVFQGLDQAAGGGGLAAILRLGWRPRRGTCASAGAAVVAAPARALLGPRVPEAKLPDCVLGRRPARRAGDNIFWAGNPARPGMVLHGYQSTWLPASLLAAGPAEDLADALFAATRHWRVSLHFNKGLAGAPAEAIAAARDTATNPAVLDAFALAISAGRGPPAYPGRPGPRARRGRAARSDAEAIGAADGRAAQAGARRPAPTSSESNYFEPNWQRAFWGANYARLRRSRTSTTRTACSSSTTASAARTGAPTG